MIILESHKVSELESNIRLSDYLPGKLKSIPTRKGIKKAIVKGQVLLNHLVGKTGDFVKEGDLIQLLDIQEQAPKAYDLDLEVLYEDDFLAIINKPAGVSVSGNQFKTIQNALIGSIQGSKQEDKLAWPKPVHRLDSATSGLLVIAKTYNAMIRLGEQFSRKEINKTYHAIVIGETDNQGKIETAIEGQNALTKFVLKERVPSLRNEYLSLLEVTLETGRTHQIRIHLSGIGHPIFGDKLYGKKGEIFKGKGLFLAATKIEFKHPILSELVAIEIEIPHKFISLLRREQRRWDAKNEED